MQIFSQQTKKTSLNIMIKVDSNYSLYLVDMGITFDSETHAHTKWLVNNVL